MEQQTQSKSSGRGGFFEAFSPLRHPAYRSYFWSGMAMTAAQGIEMLALAWLVLDLSDGSIATLGLAIFLRGIPMTVLSLFGGVLADRYNRRNILVYNQALTLVNMVALSTLVLTGMAEVWHAHLSSLLFGVASALTAPARQALIRNLVSREEMLNGVALNSMQMNASRIIWPTIAGGVIALAGTGPTFLFCGLLSAVGIVFILPIQDKREAAPGTGRRSPVRDMWEGIRFTFTTPVIAPVMTLVMAVGLFGLTFVQIAPGFAREELGLSPGEAGLFIMMSGLGSLAGNLGLLYLRVRNRLMVFTVACAGFGACLILLAVNPWYISAFVIMFLFGMFHANLSVVAQTIFQLIAPPEFLGRVTSLFMMTPGIASLITLPFGVIGEELGLRWGLAFLGVFTVAITVILGFGRLVRVSIPDQEPASSASAA